MAEHKIRIKRDRYVNFLEVISPKAKLDLLALLLLYGVYGVDIVYILNLLAGQSIKIPSHKTLVEAWKNTRKPHEDEYLDITVDDGEQNGNE